MKYIKILEQDKKENFKLKHDNVNIEGEVKEIKMSDVNQRDFWGIKHDNEKSEKIKMVKNNTNYNHNVQIDNVVNNMFWGDSSNNMGIDKNIFNISGINDILNNTNNGEITTKTINEEILNSYDDSINEELEKNNAEWISQSEINELRDNYISGNISGQDIYDADGRIIIKRNNVITKDIIRFAEKSGRLSELILNMKLK